MDRTIDKQDSGGNVNETSGDDSTMSTNPDGYREAQLEQDDTTEPKIDTEIHFGSGDDSSRPTYTDDDTIIHQLFDGVDSIEDSNSSPEFDDGTGSHPNQSSDKPKTIGVISSTEPEGDRGLQATKDFALLYLRFHVCEDIYKNDGRTKLLQERMSLFVGQTFDTVINGFFSRRHDIQENSIAGIQALNAELNKMRRTYFTPNSHWAKCFERTDRRQLTRSQLVFCVAATFMSFNSENTNMDPTNSDFETMNINDLNVPALLDIIRNCELFGRVREFVDVIVDGYVNTMLRQDEPHACMDQISTAMRSFLDQIDDQLLPDKSRYLHQVNSKANDDDASKHSSEAAQATMSTILYEREESRSSSDPHHDTETEKIPLAAAHPHSPSDPHHDTQTKQVREIRKIIALLYLQFHCDEAFYQTDARTILLKEFVTIFVEHTLEEFIDTVFSKHNIHKTSLEAIKALDVELKKMRLTHFTPNSHWTRWFEYTDCKLLKRSQLIFCAAATFMSSCSEDTPMDPTYADLETMNINTFNVPALLDIMSNCKLFSCVHKYIGTIVDAYVDNEISKENLYMYMNQLKTGIQALVDNIDGTRLPGKDRYQQRVNAYKTIHGPSKNTRQTDEAILKDRFKSIRADLKNPLYMNWVKATLTLKYLCNGARYFILEIFANFKLDFPSHFDDDKTLKEICEQVEWKSKSNKWVYPRSHCTECTQLFEKLINLHRTKARRMFQAIPAGGAWSIAQMYISDGRRACIANPDDADASALFQIIRNCFLFSQSIEFIDKIIHLRNKLMHSPSLSFTDDELRQLFESELTFLEEAETSVHDNTVRPKLTSSKNEIKKIKDLQMNIETVQAHVNDALKYHREELTKEIDQGHIEVNEEQQNILRSKYECYNFGNTSVSVLSMHLRETMNDYKQINEKNDITISDQQRRIRDLEQTIKDKNERISYLESKYEQLFNVVHQIRVRLCPFCIVLTAVLDRLL